MSDLSLPALNALANHPDIAPHVAPGYCDISLEAAWREPRNCLTGDARGVIIMAPLGRGVYQWHWMLGPEIRGADALRLGREALRKAFTFFGACAVCGATPRVNRAARLMNRALGARPIGTSVDAHGRDCINYILERETWAASLAESSAV